MSGFVYIWYDKKLKRFYVGSHWGAEDDGYVCSSNNMRHNYRNRPNDFRREILARVTTNRTDLLNEEQRWLDMIKPEEFGHKYYNINANSFKHCWWMNEDTKQEVTEKLRNNKKRSETWKKKFEDGYVIHNKGKKHSKETKKKMSGRVPWNKGKAGTYTLDLTEEQRSNRMHCDPAQIGRMGGAITGARNKGKPSNEWNVKG